MMHIKDHHCTRPLALQTTYSLLHKLEIFLKVLNEYVKDALYSIHIADAIMIEAKRVQNCFLRFGAVQYKVQSMRMSVGQPDMSVIFEG
jgi:hypothetical protein